jgi:DUF971 family protein/molybdopterin converting factor small subunit
MTTETPTPIEINLHQKSRILALRFSDGVSFELPCEYLRVFSTAAEVKASRVPITGKELVNIEKIEPQGQYAIKIVFDDGHDTGIFSWETLYQLGVEQQANWDRYIKSLKGIGYERLDELPTDRRVKIFYFSWLANKSGKESEDILLPKSVLNIADLLKLLARRRPEIASLFDKSLVRPTINKQFAEFFTRLEDGDEIALVPNRPTPPATDI